MRFTWSLGAICAAVFSPLVWAQNDNIPGVPVSVVVTAEGRHGKTVPALTQDELRVKEGRSERPITGLTHFSPGDPVQLLLLFDDSAQMSFDVEINSLKQWVNSLPPNVEVGIGYMHNGTNEMAHGFTQDHAAAANSIHLALGPAGADVSPYDSLSDAIKHWPEGAAQRKEVVMVSSGIEGLGGGIAPENPYVNKSISDAQKAGVVVFGIYNPSAGHFGHVFWRETVGQNLLSQLCDETGGESYITTFSAPVSFTPFLQDISERLGSQYHLTFEARPENKAGLQEIKVSTQNKEADVTAPSAVLVKASK